MSPITAMLAFNAWTASIAFAAIVGLYVRTWLRPASDAGYAGHCPLIAPRTERDGRQICAIRPRPAQIMRIDHADV